MWIHHVVCMYNRWFAEFGLYFVVDNLYVLTIFTRHGQREEIKNKKLQASKIINFDWCQWFEGTYSKRNI